jgi:futalosine hydrolase
MSFKILYVTATTAEAESLKNILDITPVPSSIHNLDINILVTGVGSVATAWVLKQWICTYGKPDLAINAGIAGSYRDDISIGDVVLLQSDCFADAGIEDDKEFITLFEAGFISENEFPFKHGILNADPLYFDLLKSLLKPVNAITVNTSTGSETSKSRLVRKFNPDIETMEGATFFYICSRENIPFIAIRSISNIVEKRNRDNWNIKLALDNLSAKLNDIFLTLQGKL